MFDFGRMRPPADAAARPYDGTGIWLCPEDGGPARPLPEDQAFRTMLEEAADKVGASSRRLYAALQLGRPGGRWDSTPERALFHFTSPGGAKAFARYGVVASWAPASHSWLWAWGFPGGWMPEPALCVAARARAEGERRGWPALSGRLLLANEREAWSLAALAAHLSGYPMIYRAPVNETNVHFYALDRPARAV